MPRQCAIMIRPITEKYHGEDTYTGELAIIDNTMSISYFDGDEYITYIGQEIGECHWRFDMTDGEYRTLHCFPDDRNLFLGDWYSSKTDHGYWTVVLL